MQLVFAQLIGERRWQVAQEGLVRRNWISLLCAAGGTIFVVWAHTTKAFDWLDPISAYIALACLAVIIVIDLKALIGR
jgi:hypothetical protein